jgi:hypothetical protein
MSPKFSIAALLLGALTCSVAFSAERIPPPATAQEQPAWHVPDRGTTQNDPSQARAIVLPRKDSTVDLSRIPLPWNVGPITVGAFHVFPAQEPGPYIGPLTRIWGLGFGTSLWRDPVTGWPEM